MLQLPIACKPQPQAGGIAKARLAGVVVFLLASPLKKPSRVVVLLHKYVVVFRSNYVVVF